MTEGTLYEKRGRRYHPVAEREQGERVAGARVHRGCVDARRCGRGDRRTSGETGAHVDGET